MHQIRFSLSVDGGVLLELSNENFFSALAVRGRIGTALHIRVIAAIQRSLGVKAHRDETYERHILSVHTCKSLKNFDYKD